MSLPDLLAVIAAIVGAAMGLLGLVNPEWSKGVVRLQPADDKPGGYAEFRASFGGLFLFLHAAVLASAWAGAGLVGASFAAALAWIGMAFGRVVALALDGGRGARTGYNVFGTGFELVLGALLLAPFIAHFG